jgi:hypothetical protein
MMKKRLYKIVLMALTIFSFNNVYAQSSSKPIDIKNGFKDFKLNTDISLYKDIISKEEYLIKYKNNQDNEYSEVRRASAPIFHSEYCKIWVYIGKNRKIGAKYLNSFIISTYLNKILSIQVMYDSYSEYDETDEAIFNMYGTYTVPVFMKHSPEIEKSLKESCMTNNYYDWNGRIASLTMHRVRSTTACSQQFMYSTT